MARHNNRVQRSSKLLPVYSAGERLGQITVAQAVLLKESGAVELRSQGRGRKWRLTAVFLHNAGALRGEALRIVEIAKRGPAGKVQGGLVNGN